MENKNQITSVLAPIADMRDIQSLGKIFVDSKFFQDSRDASQAIVKILAGRELGIPPVASMTGVYIVNGRPSLGSNLIAARIKSSGKYDYRVVKIDDKVCQIDFFQVNGTSEKIGESVFTMEDAKKSGTKNTDKYPRNMLFARALTNGARWYTPDIFNGAIYTPDELGAQVETNDSGEITKVINPNQPERVQPEIKTDDEFVLRIEAKANELQAAYAGNWDDADRQKRIGLMNGYLNRWHTEPRRKYLFDALFKVNSALDMTSGEIASTLDVMALEKHDDGKYYETSKSATAKTEFERIIRDYEIAHGQTELELDA